MLKTFITCHNNVLYSIYPKEIKAYSHKMTQNACNIQTGKEDVKLFLVRYDILFNIEYAEPSL